MIALASLSDLLYRISDRTDTASGISQLTTRFSKMPTIDPAEDWPFDRIQAHMAAGFRAGRDVYELISDFDDHPKYQLAVKLALVTMGEVAGKDAPKEKPKEIRFTPPADRFERWQKAADALGVPLTIWVQLAADAGVTFGQARPMGSPTVPMQETTQDGEGPIWRRILNDMEGRGVAVLKKSDIPKLATRLGVEQSRVVASLGSMRKYGSIENKGTHFQLTAKE